MYIYIYIYTFTVAHVPRSFDIGRGLQGKKMRPARFQQRWAIRRKKVAAEQRGNHMFLKTFLSESQRLNCHTCATFARRRFMGTSPIRNYLPPKNDIGP